MGANSGRNDLVGQSFPARHGPSGSVTVMKTMAGEVHRNVHHHQEHTDAGREDDLESSPEAVAGCLIVKIGHHLYSCLPGSRWLVSPLLLLALSIAGQAPRFVHRQ